MDEKKVQRKTLSIIACMQKLMDADKREKGWRRESDGIK